MPMRRPGTLATALAASLLMIGCSAEETPPEAGTPPEPVEEPAADAPVGRNKIVEKMLPDGKGMQLSATDPGGRQFTAAIGDEIEIPEEFPDDLPVFPGSTPMAFLHAPDEGVIVTFKSVEEQQDVYDFYRSALEEDGWDLLEDETADSHLSLEAIKEDRKVTVTVGGMKGDSRVSVIVTPAS